MAWLSDLAGKAENLLNKIDKNTAAVLSKDKYDTLHPQLSEVTWNLTKSHSKENLLSNSANNTSVQFPQVSSSPNFINETTTYREETVKYLNTPNISPKKNMGETFVSPSTPSSLLVEHATDNTDSVSEISIQSGRVSPAFTHTSIDVFDEDSLEANENCITTSNDEHNYAVKKMLENDIVSAADLDQQILNSVQQENKFDNERSIQLPSNDQYTRQHYRKIEKDLEKKNTFLMKEENNHQKEIVLLNEELISLKIEKTHILKQLADCQTALERNKVELDSTRFDLEQHRARALKTLQEKDKLITELRMNISTDVDDTNVMELNQLRQERDALREENQQLHKKLKIAHEEIINAESNLEKIRQQSAESIIHAQEILAAEKRKKMEAEEDVKLHAEEVRSLKDELIRQRDNMNVQLQKRNSEISRLRMQLSAMSTPNSEVESRLSSLTQTLVEKQMALENLTTERNALRLQLEKSEHEFRNCAGTSRRNGAFNVNDTDDAKAQVPTFLIETPFDTGVTRRVKRAYSSLDAISVRIGVFLRRYPLARILVIIYIAVLQLWVLFVLLSQSPEVHYDCQ